MTDASVTPSEEIPPAAEGTDRPEVQTPVQDASHPVDDVVDTSGQAEDMAVDQAVDEPVEAAVDGGADAGGDSAGHRASDERSPSARRLEEEGDIAADYVEELLDISDLDGDIDIEVRNGRTYVSVIAEEGDDRLRDLVGRDGKGLEALQELVRLAVLSATGVRSRLVLDIAGHRVDRARELEKVAQAAIASVREDGQPVHLDPMGAYERKVVHDVIAAAGLVSGSEGEGPRRHVVVSAGE